MVNLKFTLKVFFISALFSLFLPSAYADQMREMRTSLFKKVDEAFIRANKAQAKVLAPDSYNRAKKLYQKAESRFKSNKSIEKIRKDLKQAEIYFDKSTEASRLASLTFESSLKARSDAIAAQAMTKSPEKWKNAEDKFAHAAIVLEGGNLKKAKYKAQAAEEVYRSAELSAIKTSYLAEARILIQQAKRTKVDKYAPSTYKKAVDLLASAEKELSENRYDTDYPRSLARQARYEAKHAIFLADRVKQIQSGNLSTEAFLISVETPLTKIANHLDIVAEFDSGFDAPTKLIQREIENLQRDSYELGEQRTKISNLVSEISKLENSLGIQSERLAMQAAQKEKLESATKLFSTDEAIVLTHGDNFIIRPIGLSFSPGSSQINTEHFALLKKLQQALEIYKGYEIVVEGHTDSFGSDSANLTLSLKRAQAIRSYLNANMDRANGNINAVGYGETRPIANNETFHGRKKNRRIDFVLKPRSYDSQQHVQHVHEEE